LRAQNNNANKSLRTRVTVKSSKYTFKDEKIQSHMDKNGICYQIGGDLLYKNLWKMYCYYLDHVYLETNKQNEPYSIACVLDFRLVSLIIINYIYI